MIGATLRHYRIVRALGHGGMGEVYAAEDLHLHRLVALKVLPSDVASDPERLHRFQREAQAVAALNHPNIVTLYGVEEADGVHFLTMELVEGRTLGDLIPPGGLPLNDLLAIAVPLADAVRTAHEHGVIHRDLKPANIMIGAEGRLKVLDFGLAKQLRGPDSGAAAEDVSTSILTAPFHVVGTAAYMSPEQAQGRAVDARSDIFSLGVVLYEMATGARPFRGDSSASVMASIIKDDPPAPADVNATVPAELDRAIRRCLAKDPDRRYQTAIDLRNDLEDLQRQAVPVRRATSRRTRVAAGRPRRWRLAAWGALGLTMVASAAAAIWTWWPARERPAGPLNLEFTQLTSQPGVEWFPSLSPDAKWIVYAGDGASHRHIYLQSISGQTPLDISGADSAEDDDQPAFSPDGERIAFRSTRLGGGLFVMGRTGEAVKRIASAGFRPAWSPDGTRIAYTTERLELYPQNSAFQSELWIADLRSEQVRRLYAGDAVMAAWSPHGQRIAFTNRQGSPMQSDIWTIPAGGGQASVVTSDLAPDFSPAWSPDGRYIYYSSERGGSMNLWRVRVDEDSGKRLGDPEPLTTPAPLAAHAAVSPDGTHIVFTSAVLAANIQRMGFDPVTATVKGEPTWVTTGSRRWSSPDPSPDGQWVAFYSLTRPEGDLYLAHPDGTSMRQLTGDAAVDRVPRWSPDGLWIACFSTRSGPSELWKIRPDGSGLQQMTEGGGSYFTWSPDGSRIAASSGPGTNWPVRVFDPRRPYKDQKPEALPPPLGNQESRFFVNSWSPDGTRLIGEVQGVASGVLMYTLATRTYDLLTNVGEWPVWLPDSRRILFVAGGRGFYLLDARTKAVKQIYSVARDVVGPPRLSRDGKAMFYSRRVTEADVWLATLK